MVETNVVTTGVTKIMPIQHLRLAAAFCGACLTLLVAGGQAIAQSGPRLIDTGRLDQRTPAPPGGAAVPTTSTATPRPPAIEGHRFVLTSVDVVGAVSLPAATLRATWKNLVGHTVTVADVYHIADTIGAAYTQAGYALYSVTVPRQPFDGGPVRINVIEGYVAAVVIEGDTKGADLSLLKAYAARITAERPLRQATLERAILLMNAIPGLKVGSRFESVAGQPGAVRLRLGIQRKPFEYGAGFNNQGASVLSQLQLEVNAAANGLLQEGDRSQIVFGFPTGLSRYQYYGFNHTEPIGDNGATITVSIGDLVTHQQNDLVGGNAIIGSIQARYPIILGVKESLAATGEFDLLDARNAFLGATLTDERTRAARLGLNYAVQDGLDGIDGVAVTLSEGLDVLGAQRGSIAYGGPEFTKLTLRLAREQPLPDNFYLRGRMAGQYAFQHLPASEQFALGGPDFGQAFQLATLYGDQAVAGAAEAAYRLPARLMPHWLNQTELFVSGDWARLWNRQTLFAFQQNTGASAVIGVRTKLLDKVSLQIDAARVLVQPASLGGTGGWNCFVWLTGNF